MNFSASITDQVVNKLPYPIGKAKLVQISTQQYGANAQLTNVMQKLPDKTFNTPQEMKDGINSLDQQELKTAVSKLDPNAVQGALGKFGISLDLGNLGNMGINLP